MLESEAHALHESLIRTLTHQEAHIKQAAALLSSTLVTKGKVLICGNGGSAAEAQHFSAELMVRLKKNRRPISAIALTTDTSTLTACGNDYSFEDIFARQIAGLAQHNDVLICLTTSGNSPNILKAAEEARKHGCKVISITGELPSKVDSLSDVLIKVSSDKTERIQEVHLFLIHYLAGVLEQEVLNERAN